MTYWDLVISGGYAMVSSENLPIPPNMPWMFILIIISSVDGTLAVIAARVTHPIRVSNM